MTFVAANICSSLLYFHKSKYHKGMYNMRISAGSATGTEFCENLLASLVASPTNHDLGCYHRSKGDILLHYTKAAAVTLRIPSFAANACLFLPPYLACAVAMKMLVTF